MRGLSPRVDGFIFRRMSEPVPLVEISQRPVMLGITSGLDLDGYTGIYLNAHICQA